jgi:YbbR domain-containing protein
MPDGLRLDAILPNSIEVTIGQTVQKVVDEQGLSDDYFWTAAPNRVNVLVAGPVQRLQRLRPTEISVTLNLAGLEPGFHRLRPTVTAPDQIVIDSISPETLNVVIEPKTGIAITGTATITGVIVPNSVIATVTPNSKEN